MTNWARTWRLTSFLHPTLTHITTLPNTFDKLTDSPCNRNGLVFVYVMSLFTGPRTRLLRSMWNIPRIPGFLCQLLVTCSVGDLINYYLLVSISFISTNLRANSHDLWFFFGKCLMIIGRDKRSQSLKRIPYNLGTFPGNKSKKNID